jgi:hypothetical protein
MLLPFGERSRLSVSGAEPIEFAAASIDLPRDPSVVTLNRHHNRHDPVGRATLLEKRDGGVYAEFRIADTDEGDAYLRDESSKLRKLSAEVAGIVREGARALRSKLTGAALVTEGAFASAALFAVAQSEEHHEDTYTDPNGVTWKRVEDTTRQYDDETNKTTTTSTVVEQTEAAPAEDTTKEEEEFGMTKIVPDTPGAHTKKRTATVDGMFAAIASGDPERLEPYREAGDLFALDTIQHSGPTDETIGTDTATPGLLGELWERRSYRRKFIPLLTQQRLTNYRMIGWRWTDKPEVDDYAGNTAEVPSNTVDTEDVPVTANRLAGGHRLDRRFRDFGDTTVISSYLTHQADDYARKSDAKALAAIMAAATTTAPGTVPAGISEGLAAIVDGALGVIGTENTPSYALVSPELWRDILLTPKDDVLAYLQAGFGFEEGSLPGFRIMPANVGTGKVIVGAQEAITFWELGETPIRVDGVVPGNGAEDIAVFGYWASLANNTAAVRSVTVVAE